MTTLASALRLVWWVIAVPLSAVGLPLSLLGRGLVATVVPVVVLSIAATIGVLVRNGNDPVSAEQLLLRVLPEVVLVVTVTFCAVSVTVPLGGMAALFGFLLVLGGGLVLLADPMPLCARRVRSSMLARDPAGLPTTELVVALMASGKQARTVSAPDDLAWIAERRGLFLEELERRDPGALTQLWGAGDEGAAAA